MMVDQRYGVVGNQEESLIAATSTQMNLRLPVHGSSQILWFQLGNQQYGLLQPVLGKWKSQRPVHRRS